MRKNLRWIGWGLIGFGIAVALSTGILGAMLAVNSGPRHRRFIDFYVLASFPLACLSAVGGAFLYHYSIGNVKPRRESERTGALPTKIYMDGRRSRVLIVTGAVFAGASAVTALIAFLQFSKSPLLLLQSIVTLPIGVSLIIFGRSSTAPRSTVK